jgi:glycogen synthase
MAWKACWIIRKEFLGGIINGIDLDQWDPETDPYITQHFTRSNAQ